jgi:hypothetical protein
MSLYEMLSAFPLYVSAVVSVTMIWLDGSLLSVWRARWQAYGGWRAELTRCPLCASCHFTVYLGLVYIMFWFLPAPWHLLPLAALVIMAVPAPAYLGYHLVRGLSFMAANGVDDAFTRRGTGDDARLTTIPTATVAGTIPSTDGAREDSAESACPPEQTP